MNKKNNLLIKSAQYFFTAIILNILGFVALFIYWRQLHMQILIIMLIINAILALSYYFSYLTPALKMRRKYHLFSRGKIFEELFEENYMLFPEQGMAMEYIHKILNKQDAINLTKRQAEYLALQNQINPHFLYNTLEAIRGDALSEGLRSIAETTEALASFFRYTISDMGNLVTLEREIENSENYFTIQQYRFGEKLKMEIIVPENEPGLYQLMVPKLTLQPIIENAIFHGLEQITGDGYIKISFETTVTRLFINVTDNGIGIDPGTLKKLNDALEQVGVSGPPEHSKKGSGIALRNVSRRIKLLFGDQYGLHLFSTPDFGTDVRISLPKLTQNEIAADKTHVL